MILIESFLTWVLYKCFKLIYVYLSEEIRFENAIDVWNWWYKPTYMTRCFFFSILFLKVHNLNNSIYIWNCYNQEQFLNEKVGIKSPASKAFAWNFVQLSIQKS